MTTTDTTLVQREMTIAASPETIWDLLVANAHSSFHADLTAIRAGAKQRARELPPIDAEASGAPELKAHPQGRSRRTCYFRVPVAAQPATARVWAATTSGEVSN